MSVFTVVNNGFAALESLNHAHYDLLIVQDTEEELCGDALMRIVRNIGYSIPVILMKPSHRAPLLLSPAVREQVLKKGGRLEIGEAIFDNTLLTYARQRGYASTLFLPFTGETLLGAITSALSYNTSAEAGETTASLQGLPAAAAAAHAWCSP